MIRRLTFCHEHERYLIWWPLSSWIWILMMACSSSLEMTELASDAFFASYSALRRCPLIVSACAGKSNSKMKSWE